MSIVNKWNVFCEIEGVNLEVTSLSGNPPPTKCPNDSSHAITSEKTFLIEVIQDHQIKIKEESIPTQGFFKIEGKIISCGINTTSSQDTILKHAVSILAFYISPTSSNFKDILDVYINIGAIGVLSEATLTGSNAVKLTTPVFSNIPIGFEIIINGVCIGEVISKNAGTQTLTLETPVLQDFAANSVVVLRNRMMKNFIIGMSPRYDFGSSIIGGSYMSPNYTVSATYTNKSLSESKELIYYIEYLY